MRPMALVTTVGFLLLAPGGALADGGPVLPAQGGAGIGVPGGSVRFVAKRAGRNTVIERVATTTRRVEATVRVPGVYGIPGAAYDGTLTGLATDGRTLILAQIPTTYPVRTTRLLVVSTPRMRVEKSIVLPGWSNVDAISPNGRWIYLIHYSSSNSLRYEVLAYDLPDGRMLSKPIVDPSDGTEAMTGFPLNRVMSPGGRWAYTLYFRPSGVPFIHALDTVGLRAKCIDLPSLGGLGFNTATFKLGPGANTLEVRIQGSVAATINTRTFAVSTTGPLAGGLPRAPASQPARSGRQGGGGPGGGQGGSSLPWELILVPIAAAAALAAAVWRHRRGYRSERASASA
jgi:hypothetical protein